MGHEAWPGISGYELSFANAGITGIVCLSFRPIHGLKPQDKLLGRNASPAGAGALTPNSATQLTNGFGKKVENLEHVVALHFMYYNFGRIHKTLHVTPAMEAGIRDHIGPLEDLAKLVD